MDDLGLVGPKRSESADIRRSLSQDDVAWIDEDLRNEIESLLGSGGHDDVVGMAANAVRTHDLNDHLAQFLGPLTGTILED